VWLPSLTNCVTARAIGVAVVLGPLGGGGGGPAIISVSQWASVLSMTSMYEDKHLRVDTLCVCVCVRARARAWHVGAAETLGKNLRTPLSGRQGQARTTSGRRRALRHLVQLELAEADARASHLGGAASGSASGGSRVEGEGVAALYHDIHCR
jgi:hypothetical protein